MEPKTGKLKSFDGLQLFYRIYEAPAPPRAIIAYFHGVAAIAVSRPTATLLNIFRQIDLPFMALINGAMGCQKGHLFTLMIKQISAKICRAF